MARREYRALLIGNSRFPQDQHNLQTLEGPVKDVALLNSALTHPDVGLFPHEQVRLLVDHTSSEIMRELNEFFVSAHRDDCLLFYYSGHGLLDEHNRLFLCANDTRSDLLLGTAVSSTQINMMIDSSAARTTVILLDCCHSGAFKSGSLPDSLKGEGRFLVTSARGGQLANDADRANGTSLFTQHVVEGLLGEARDTNGDGYVDLAELYDYVRDSLVVEHRQRPQRNFSGGGDVAIARRVVVTPAMAEALDTDRPAGAEAVAALPILDLSETVIDLRDIRAGETLPPERIAVLNRGDGQLDWTVETTNDWLEIERSPHHFELRLHPAVGTNRGNVLVQDRITGATKTLRVRVDVTEPEAPPRLEVSDTEVHFGRLQQHAPEPRRTLFVRNLGGGRLELHVTTSEEWLLARQLGKDVVVWVDTAVPGRHNGEVVVDSNGGMARIQVSAEVVAEPQLEVSPERLDFGSVVAGSPAEFTLAVRNRGGGHLQWDYRVHGDFFLAEPVGEGVRCRLRANPGNHSGMVTIRSNGGEKRVPVTAVVRPTEPRAPKAASSPVPGEESTSSPRSGARAAVLSLVGLLLSLLVIGIVPAGAAIVMARRARRASGSSGSPGALFSVARVVGWLAVAASALAFIGYVIQALESSYYYGY